MKHLTRVLLGLALFSVLTGSRLAASTPRSSSAADGSWLPTSDAPLAGRYRHSAVWTGEGMLVWGGYYHLDHFLNDGALYDPLADTWEAISTLDAPAGRLRHTAVWTGSHMIIWGGEHGGGGVTTNTGGLYHMESDSWEVTSLVNAPSARQLHTAIWTGSEMIVWGGCNTIQCTTRYGDGFRYDPATDTWTPISSVGAPSARFMHTAVWTGDEMIIWGGCGSSNNPCTQFVGDGARYDPKTDTWKAITASAAPSPRRRHTAVWGGAQMLVWGGENGASSLSDGATYDPATDEWAAMSSADGPSPRFSHTAVWTGADMIVWGGNTDTGAVYHPGLDAWAPVSAENAPSSRIFHVAVWAEGRMVVWGGAAECTPSVCTGFLDTGGVYTPAGRPVGGATSAARGSRLVGPCAVAPGALLLLLGIAWIRLSRPTERV